MKKAKKTDEAKTGATAEKKESISLSELEDMVSSEKCSKRSISVEEAIEDLENQADSEYTKISIRRRRAQESLNRTTMALTLTNQKAVLVAVGLFAVTASALGLSGMVSNAATANGVELLEAEYIDFEGTTTESSAILQELLSKKVAYNVVGKGSIEAYANCTIDEENLTILFTDNAADAQVKIIPESGYAPILSAEQEISSFDGVITLDNDIDYGILSITFIPEQEAKNRPLFEDVDDSTVISKVSLEGDDPIVSAAVPPSSNTSSPAAPSVAPATHEDPAYEAEEPSYSAPEPAPAPAPASEPAYEAPAQTTVTTTTTTTYSTTVGGETTTSSSAPAKTSPSTNPNSMSSEEYEVARSIFDAYNNFRASKGLNRVSWSDACADMAYSSSMQCAARGTLTHRLGIPASSQHCFSDILQYSSWKMSGDEAVITWKNSEGHRKQMQCSSATEAGVGVYYNGSDGRWYYTIVYDFSGTNVGGN